MRTNLILAAAIALCACGGSPEELGSTAQALVAATPTTALPACTARTRGAAGARLQSAGRGLRVLFIDSLAVCLETASDGDSGQQVGPSPPTPSGGSGGGQAAPSGTSGSDPMPAREQDESDPMPARDQSDPMPAREKDQSDPMPARPGDSTDPTTTGGDETGTGTSTPKTGETPVGGEGGSDPMPADETRRN